MTPPQKLLLDPSSSSSSTSSSHPDDDDKDGQIPPGSLIRYLWTCHKCGCGSFIRGAKPVAVCLHCAHEICTGCTSAYGARLLSCVDADKLSSTRPLNPGCICDPTPKSHRCRPGRPIRRCPTTYARAQRHAPYSLPSLVQHCIVTFRPDRQGRPALGTFLFTRPRFLNSSPASATATARLRRPSSGNATTTLDCIANSVAAATARSSSSSLSSSASIIPPIYDMLRRPRPDDPHTAHVGIRVSTAAAARFFASGMASVARNLGLAYPVVCVHVDPMLAFVAYYLCASFCVVYMAWREAGGKRPTP